MRHTSATFDEILLAAGGARGFETGNFDLVHLYHPRVLPYLYGLPVFLANPTFPVEAGQWEDRAGFSYSRALFFEGTIPPQDLLLRARSVAVLLAMGFICLVFLFVHRYFGPRAGWVAAILAAFLPDVLAHGGISYNDVPIGIAFLGSVWALDRAARLLTLRSVLVAAGVVGLSLGVKYSSVVLAPIGLILIALEAAQRGEESVRYLIRALSLFLVACGAVYLVTVALHLGDFTLQAFREGLIFNLAHAISGDPAPTWLLGQHHPGGVWYFFPVAFLIKTPVALHVLTLIALLATAWQRPRLRTILSSPLRGPLVAIGVVGLSLLTSSLQIGFRHAFPVIPFFLILVAVGLEAFMRRWGRAAELLVGTLCAAYIVSVLSWYPHFIPYVSEYFPDRDRGHLLIADSSHDWGQGLIELRKFMEEEGIPRVYLSYFGTANPAAYGISFVPLRSYYRLQEQVPPDSPPRFVAISATNLAGSYIDDVLAHYREREPYRVLGHTVFIYEVDGDPTSP